MDRPSRSIKSVTYTDFQDDDDEDFAAVKPPSKKSRTTAKDPDSERNPKTSSIVVDLTSSGQQKTQRVSLEDKLYERDLEAALTLSLLDSPVTGGEVATKAEAHNRSEAPPPVLTHCNDANSRLDEHQFRPDSPPMLSNCSVDGNSLGLNLIINMKTSPPSVSKPRKVSEQERKPLKNSEDEDYQPQNTPNSDSDANFTEEDESEDETFTVTKKNVKMVGQKTEKKTPQTAKQKKEKKEKLPAKASKVKNSASSSTISGSAAASVSGLKTPTTPPLSKPALSSSPAGGRLAKWNPPGLVGRSPSETQNAPVTSPGQGLRLGLSRLARVKPLHPNAPAH
ncbi:RAD51-associated protein 1 isoform X2 [Triplophysa rosa]|uniref:RAD51-associated protein 1 isoform X2 n=1 Tax=Triplophysa rosa TaxID=992332 RepID=UPI002545E1E3|nr:RAD51-associated protein 1 isoform X2 [Triplophysa rosa]